MELIAIELVPLFVTVSGLVVEVPTVWPRLNASTLFTESFEPIPVRLMISGLVGPLSVMVRVAERGPGWVGEKVTLNEQLCCEGIDTAVHPEMEKSEVAPESCMLCTASAFAFVLRIT